MVERLGITTVSTTKARGGIGIKAKKQPLLVSSNLLRKVVALFYVIQKMLDILYYKK